MEAIMILTKFQESLLVISAMKNIMENDLRVFKRYKHDEDLKYSLNNKMLIDICSFMKEWKRFNNYAKHDEHIRETMKITAPAIQRISQWTGLEGMRNTLLAHGYRDDNNQGKLTCLNKRYFNADVPTTYAEVMLLSEYCVYTIATFICRHRNEHQKAMALVPNWNHDVKRGIETQGEFDAEVEKLQAHMFNLDPSLKQCFDV